ncbi:hypothetical protein EDC94DRAFT_698755 [Helicostylum pulchrum]|uniref:Arrestin C-terminal-like domain-containing protein n=1 Tax=Helicostylum pulchrum TaxID=562976 RepID=A0ABP9YFE4_9FUNG|nr:hypothetical protein EDC94DRAFT_698755 [Helicostylum pulchrum]
MTDLFKNRESEFYIDLKQERYFFPGEDVSGDIVLDLKKETKTKNIKVVLEGLVDLGGRTMVLFSKSVLTAEAPDGEKYYALDPHTHRFPFMITIPTSKECKVPSTLEISKLLKVSYRLTATYNKVFTMFSASATCFINVLEEINVESPEYRNDFKVEKELYLTGAHKPVRVSTIIGKRAAVKGDTIPISIKIEHIGVMVRDKAISVQLLRSVYYGRNMTELFGPKVLKEVTANIEISGPVSFTKTFKLNLAIPKDTCPTVYKSGQSFKIEYTIHVSVNLNEENPYRKETSQEFVLFNLPFTVGTCPKLTFNIDDDEDDEESEINEEHRADDISIHSSEYDQVTETMKHLELDVEAPVEMVQQKPRYTPPKPAYIPLPMVTSRPDGDAFYKPDSRSPINEDQHPLPILIATPSSPPLDETEDTTVPAESELATNSGGSSPPLQYYQPAFNTVESPPPEQTVLPSSSNNSKNAMSPSAIFNDYNPGLIQPSSSTSTTATGGTLGRHDSSHWVVRNADTSVPPVSPVVGNFPSPGRDNMARIQPSSSTSTTATGSTLGQQDSAHWAVRNADTAAPPVSPVMGNLPPALPLRPSRSSDTRTGSPEPDNKYQLPTFAGMPVPEPRPHFNQIQYNPQYNQQYAQYNQYNHSPQYNNNHAPPPQYNNYNPNYRPQPQPNVMPFPAPFAPNYGMMGMPSHHNYQGPPPQHQSYPYYPNN